MGKPPLSKAAALSIPGLIGGKGGMGMTLGQVLTRIGTERPGESGEGELIRWLSQLDGKWFTEVVLTHVQEETAAFAGYTTETDRETVLLIAPPYDEVYMPYLYAMIDQRLGEIERYNNDAILFIQGWTEARKSYHQRVMPLEKSWVRGLFRQDRKNAGENPLNL